MLHQIKEPKQKNQNLMKKMEATVAGRTPRIIKKEIFEIISIVSHPPRKGVKTTMVITSKFLFPLTKGIDKVGITYRLADIRVIMAEEV